jgi:hypothetical protein
MRAASTSIFFSALILFLSLSSGWHPWKQAERDVTAVKKKNEKLLCVCSVCLYRHAEDKQLPTKTRNRPSRITTLLAGHNGRFFFQKSDRLLLPLRAHPSIRVTRLLNRDLVIISLCVQMPSELNARYIIIGIIVAPAWWQWPTSIFFFRAVDGLVGRGGKVSPAVSVNLISCFLFFCFFYLFDYSLRVVHAKRHARKQ